MIVLLRMSSFARSATVTKHINDYSIVFTAILTIVVVILGVFEMQSCGEELDVICKQICIAFMARIEGNANAKTLGNSATVLAHKNHVCRLPASFTYGITFR